MIEEVIGMAATQIQESTLTKTAFELAKKYHEGQVDKAEEPYIYHVLAVGLFAGLDAKDNKEMERLIAIGLLHDILEDTKLEISELRKRIKDPVVCDTVVILTRKKDETYAEYILRVKESRLATIVKLADIELHLRSTNGFEMPESLKKRYEKARSALMDENK